MAKFKVTDHFLVPEHTLLNAKEEKEVLKEYGIAKNQLPKIKQSDPCIRSLGAKGDEIKPGRIVRIVRKSKTAGKSIAFRVVVES